MHLLYKAAYTLFIAVLIGIGSLLVATMVPVPGNIELKIVQSGSMEPSIPVGSLVMIRGQEQYAVGDVITFGEDTQESVPTTHRIVERVEQNGAISYITKGDANEAPDPQPVAKSSVIGEIIAHVPYAGYLLDFARTPIGFSLLVGLPAALVIIEESINIYREVRRRFTSGRRTKHTQHNAEKATHQDTSAHEEYEDARRQTNHRRHHRVSQQTTVDGIVGSGND